ncbi:Tetratricopeptide repeat-containing protein [Oryzisolibacter propanilivorax]|uniref:Tetratricopeptide repeat-containing protein n=1 Tax=Oryzisolibacter propanilivorax TaxID=1527607 RepID=A0A1G9REK3_9BURK|nr:OmpA family protein [Oryzisolibacter propanilivorax]SDM21267.1 Tetratricopeptide repeat-containing protein [Oryzisolibacter propanilivorax]
MPLTTASVLRRARHVLGGCLLGVLAACISNPPAPPAAAAGSLPVAVARLGDDLAGQLNTSILQRMRSRRVVLDPFIDAHSGQQTASAAHAAQLLTQRLAMQDGGLKIEPFDAQGVQHADYVIAGTLARPDGGGADYVLSATVTERRTALVIASSTARVAAAEIDAAPTAYFADSPSLVSDRLTQGYIQTARAPQGSAADGPYLASLDTAALINEATQAYDAGRHADALARYQAAAQRPDGQQLRVFNGLYNCHGKLGQTQQAEAAFAQIVALGLATDNLAVRLLFNPGTTEFWRERAVSAVYPAWLRQIARETVAGAYCLTVVGHTSRTGSETVNERLSQARARAVRELLLAHERALAGRIEVDGRGWRENIIGSGTDDTRDSLDRRVEFKVRHCSAG